MEYELGQRFRLKQHVGAFEEHGGVATIKRVPDAAIEAALDRHHPLWEGQVGVVDGLCPSLPGRDQPHVEMSFDYHDPVTRQPIEGRHNVPGEFPRRASFTHQEMADWFEPVTDVPSGFEGVVG